MKKIVLAAVGLTGLLASCGGTLIVQPSDPVRNLQLNAYQSQYTLPTAYTDTATGTTYPKGTSIICDNLTTRLNVELTWDGTISMVGARLVGRDTGSTSTVYSSDFGDLYSARPTSVEFVVGPNTAPLSVESKRLSSQDIVVTPVNTFTVKGATFVDLQAQSSDGTKSNVVQSVQALPVADCTL
ncbi:hypothetical protein [Deinococcus daejeonensis]|uniref:Lipoprotein n=1 Tax=Deinococcus daejeonensis TaxID=1007098 RepID=A0ABQ2J0B6_9DEIO|nr:hypothetical protein [Deinococcus daejeonensis]GGN34368.1 hypothetical protein GCM10010842_12930 [Deinococcus daejeonensis]